MQARHVSNLSRAYSRCFEQVADKLETPKICREFDWSYTLQWSLESNWLATDSRRLEEVDVVECQLLYLRVKAINVVPIAGTRE